MSFLRLFLQQDLEVHIWSGLSRSTQHDLTALQNLLEAVFSFLVNLNGAQEGIGPPASAKGLNYQKKSFLTFAKIMVNDTL